MVEIDYEACVGCALCAKVCPTGAISVTLGMPKVNPLICSACGQCIDVCRTGAIHWKYKEIERRRPRAANIGRGVRTRGLFSRQKGPRRWDRGESDLLELRQRLQDLKKKAEEIARRIEDL